MVNKTLLSSAIASMLLLGQGSAIAQPKQIYSEIDDYCFESPQNSICENKESYISLEKWDKHRTECALTAEWEEKKCKVIAGDRELIVYVEQEVLSESLPNTLTTEEIRIPLDNMFAFDTQWWLANTKTNILQAVNVIGSFPNLKIGFIPIADDSTNPSGKFLIISAKSLHRTVEEIESWRYYLPNTEAFAAQLKFDPNRIDKTQSIASNVAKLEETGECAYCNLEGADLTEMNLDKVNLQGANLQGANLQGSSLKEAYLLGANLNQANLYQADLEEINLIFASLENADLADTSLKGANLQNANLNNALLNAANLNPDRLDNTNLKNASLVSADLSDADLRCTNLQSANFAKANLAGADLSSCEHKSDRAPSNLKLNNRGGFLKDLRFNSGAETVSGILQIAGYVANSINNPASSNTLNVTRETIYHLDSNLASADFSGANLTDANLTNALLTDINLSQAILDNTKFQDNDLSNANFINTDIAEVDFGKDPVSICEATFSDESIYDEYCYEEEEAEE